MDRDLVELAKRGDAQALESLMVASHPRLYRLAYGILRDRHLADDATQRALLDIWKDVRRLRDPARFDAWSSRLILRICYDEARRQRAWVPEGAWDGSARLRAPDPYGAVLDRDQLERGFRRLSVEHRAILVLRCLLDMPIGQVAETLGIAPGTVGSRLSRAISALRAALEAEARTPAPAAVRQEAIP